jgi:hypothetical protein
MQLSGIELREWPFQRDFLLLAKAPRPAVRVDRPGLGHNAAGMRVMTERLAAQRRVFACSELQAKGTEFYAGTARLIATKEPPSGTNQPGHSASPSCGERLRLVPG